jgi:oxalate decarboxylase
MIFGKDRFLQFRAKACIRPKEELYIFQSTVPGPLAADRVLGAGPPPSTFSHRLMAQESPTKPKNGPR